MLGEVYQPTGHRFEVGELMPEKTMKSVKNHEKEAFFYQFFEPSTEGSLTSPVQWGSEI